MAGKDVLPDNVVRVVTEHPFAHLRAVERALIEADEVPLVGGIPDFPWEGLREQLQHRFGLSSLELEGSTSRWLEAESAYGKAMESVSMTCPSLEGELAWLIEDVDLGQLVQLLGGGPHVALLADGPLKQSFIRFLAIEVLDALRAVGYPHQMVPHLKDTSPLSGPALLTEIVLRTQNQEARFHLLLSEQFCRSARRAFAPAKPTQLSETIARQIMTPVHLQIGSVLLSSEEFQNLRIGDFISLDVIGVDPQTGTGTVVLEAAGKPFAQATTQGSQLELKELGHG